MQTRAFLALFCIFFSIYFNTLKKYSPEELELMIDLCQRHNIRASQIGSGATVNTSTIGRVLSRKTLQPSDDTIKEIEDHLKTVVPQYFDEHGLLASELDKLKNTIRFESNEDFQVVMSLIQSIDDETVKSKITEWAKDMITKNVNKEIEVQRLKDTCNTFVHHLKKLV